MLQSMGLQRAGHDLVTRQQLPISFKSESEGEVAQSFSTLRDPIDCSLPRLLCPWDFPGKNTGVGCHALLQGIFLTQGPNPRLFQGVASFNPHTSLADRTTDAGFIVEEMKTQSS